MKMINKKFSFTILVFTFLLISLFAIQTMAWISIGGDNHIELNFGDFKVLVYSKNKTEDLKFTDGVFKLNGLNEQTYIASVPIIEANYPTYVKSNNPYIEDFNMSITINADIAGYIRIRLLDEWVVTRRYLGFDRVKTEAVFTSGETVFPFQLEEGWFYDAKSNYCYYDKMIEKGTKNLSIPFITKGYSYTPKESSFFIETCDLTFGTSIQVVQANRYQEIWGLDAIPTKPVEPNEQAKEVK